MQNAANQSTATQALEDFYNDLAAGRMPSDKVGVTTIHPDAIARSQQDGVVAGKFYLNINEALPELTSEFADAYGVKHKNGDSESFYALVFKTDYQIRLREIIAMKNAVLTNHLSPVDYALVNLPTYGSVQLVAIMPKPKWPTLREFLKGENIDRKEIADKVLTAVVGSINALHHIKVAHGRINPDNIFVTNEQEIILGECVSELYGFSQLPAYQTIGQMQCTRYGWGAGTMDADYYALGVLLFFVMSDYDFADRASSMILSNKISDGSFSVLNLHMNLSTDMADLIAGLVTDDRSKCWGYESVQKFLQHGQYTVPPVHSNYERPIIFCEQEIFSKAALADAMANKWDEAREFIKLDSIIKWVGHSGKNQELVETLIELRDYVRTKTGMQKLFTREDELLIKTIILLDPYGPLRLRNLSFYKEAAGTLLINGLAAGMSEVVQTIANCVFVDFFAFYDMIAIKFKDPNLASNTLLLKNAGNNFRKAGFSFGIERLIYDLNPLLPSKSLALSAQWCLGAQDVILSIEATNSETQLQALFNKNLITFIASKVQLEQDYKLKDGKQYSMVVQSKELQVLALYAIAQKKFNISNIPKIAGRFNTQLQELLKSAMHSVEHKKMLFHNMDEVAARGNLHELLSAVVEGGYLDKDFEGYASALKRVNKMLDEIKSLQKPHVIENEAMANGQRFAINASYFISGFAIISAMLKVM